jgi:hypothetical protein
LQSLLANTLGIIFMGTPHGGSYLAHWGDTVAKYVNISGARTETSLKTFGRALRTSKESKKTFSTCSAVKNVKLKVFCFYEALKMNDAVGKVVENWSAILSAYDSCSINTQTIGI